MRMRSAYALLFVLLLGVMAAAQQSRDYAIGAIRHEFSPDRTRFSLFVSVINRGADAQATSQVTILQNGRILAQETLPPLQALETLTLEIPFITADFTGGSIQSFRVEVGIDALEPADSPLASNNSISESVAIPLNVPRPADETANLMPLNFDTIDDYLRELVIVSDNRVTIGKLDFDKFDFVLALVGGLGIFLALWMLSVILRMVFKREPRLAIWQPPYATAPLFDQNTLEGRRQAWQQFAQNCLILAAPAEGNLHPVKMLLGANGGTLNDWQVSALRLSQYDTYGRITRSQSISEKKLIKRLNQLLKRRSRLSEAKLEKQLRSLARALVRNFRKKIAKKNAFLPLAFDMRLNGKHGEVRIFFELYQFQQGAWYRIDIWEPNMLVVKEKMQENFTFTIHGMSSGETYRTYLKRLEVDLTWLLLETLRIPPIPSVEASPEALQPAPVSFHVPDTLSGMQPLSETG